MARRVAEQISVTSVGGMLVFGVFTADDGTFLAIRKSDGTWQPGWSSLNQLTGGNMGGTSLAAAQGEL